MMDELGHLWIIKVLDGVLNKIVFDNGLWSWRLAYD